MKFGKEYESQMVPEWQEAYMDYNDLKSLLKEIQSTRQNDRTPPKPTALERPMTLCRAFSGLLQRQNFSTTSKKDHSLSTISKKDHSLSTTSRKDHSLNTLSKKDHSIRITSKKDIESQFGAVNSLIKNGAESFETIFRKIAEEGEETEQEFFRRLDEEFNKVTEFYKDKVQEVIAEADILSKQMDALIAFRVKRNKMQDPTPFGPVKSNRINPMDDKVQKKKSRNNKQVPLEVLNHVKLNNTLDTPGAIIKGIVHSPELTEETITSENLKNVEKQLKRAFVEFYRKIRHLKGFSYTNILAFSKIMKKYDKITSRKASESYMKMVDRSHLGNSDEVTKLIERVEAVFVKHFSNSNRSKGMDTLRPKAKRERHRISFSVGFLAGCSFALVLALVFVIHARKIMEDRGRSSHYMETMFPLYSFFGFIVLHMSMYAANIYFWRQYRVNYSFIFGFKPGSDMSYREVLLVSFGLAGLALASVLSNLDMEMNPETYDYRELTELLPLGLLLLVIAILICPFNIMYRPSRIFFLTCLCHCLLAPLYKVTLQDFFLADQLTSQVQSLRSLEFYVCYYGWGGYTHRKNNCKTNSVYNTFYFIVAVLPYLSRFLQCLRRLYEEGDRMQGYNGLKYLMAIIAICTRTAYGLYKGARWRLLSGTFSAIATLCGVYWDLVIDWGLLQPQSKNKWLRDKLLVPSKSVYFAAMVMNVLLRFAWLQTVLDLNFRFLHSQTLVVIIASLEIIRRGIWNFFRLENEHLNNVGKYRAFKSVPLPFTYNENEDKDE